MKIEYSAALYRKIANLHLNKIVQVRNRKGRNITIHITNLTQLSWQELQLLNGEGDDRFSKMVALYEKYTTLSKQNDAESKNLLRHEESEEIQKYIDIYYNEGYCTHIQVNEYITGKNLWHQFPTIRSLNDHGEYRNIPGIQPKYFEIICRILKISGENGRPLDSFRAY